MTLLQGIQSDAVDSKSDLPMLLRKCRILASRLKNDEFKNWVQHELDGYPVDVPVPTYRKVGAQSYGHFAGAFGSGLRNAPIPFTCIPEQYREFVSTVVFHDGVSALQDLVSRDDGTPLNEQWPADLVAMVSSRIYERMNLGQAWKAISPSTVVGILDTVRNRILNFVLEIEKESPNAGEGTLSTDLTTEKVNNVFNTYILGNVGNVATGSSHVEQHATLTISQGDWGALANYLESLGIQEKDILGLKEAVTAEPKTTTAGFGEKVASWMGRMIAKAAQGAWKVTTTVASNLLSKAMAQYYGLPNP
mgnify:CR=1 FL=1